MKQSVACGARSDVDARGAARARRGGAEGGGGGERGLGIAIKASGSFTRPQLGHARRAALPTHK